MKLTALLKWTFIILLALVLCGGWAAARGTWAQAPNDAGAPASMPLSELRIYYLPFLVKSTPPGWLDITHSATLQFPRIWHTATRLVDGKVLVAGGSRASMDFLAEVERFDPAAGQTGPVAPLHTPRHQHTATLLTDGRVLVVGGYYPEQGWLSDAEVYDPTADVWTVTPMENGHGVSHTATLLQDGRVLVVGGAIGDDVLSDRADLFDPATGAWTAAAALGSVRASHTAQLLADGRVLVAGGFGYGDAAPTDGDALLYDPRADAWTATGPMVAPRIFSASVLLPDGRVLVAGGATTPVATTLRITASATAPVEETPIVTASTEIYDPAANTWTAAADLALPRIFHDLVLFPDGQALAIGGASEWDSAWTEHSIIHEIERYDPAANAWRIVGELPQPAANGAATPLQDGRVWATGGQNDATYFADTWLIGPPQAP